jgi:2-dehydro-3-deoxygluconokinase
MADGDRDLDLVSFGETMALFTATSIGRAANATGWAMSVGGAESNAMVAAARLGARAAWFGLVGGDAAGDVVESRLLGERLLVRIGRRDRFTGVMIRHHRRAGQTAVDYHRAGSAASLLSPEDVPVDLIMRARMLHVTGITPALSRSAADAVDRAVDLAHSTGALVSLDVNYRSKLWSPPEAVAALRPLVARADVVFAGVEEARLVAGSDETDIVRLAGSLRALGAGDVVLKRGAQGALALVGEEVLEQPAVPTTVVDPVGAGDAFVGGYLAAQACGGSPRERLRLAARVGAYAVSVPGDFENLPSRDDLDVFLTSGEVHR